MKTGLTADVMLIRGPLVNGKPNILEGTKLPDQKSDNGNFHTNTSQRQRFSRLGLPFSIVSAFNAQLYEFQLGLLTF